MEEITQFGELASLDEVDLSQVRKLQYDFDLIVIGSGPAGQKAAFSAVKKGARVALVEMDPLAGGVCLNTGTIPSKAFREAIVYLTGYRQRGYYGEKYRLKDKVQAGDLISRTNHVVQMERAVINEALHRNGITRLVGRGRITGPHEVTVETGQAKSRYRTGAIVLAVGTKPRRPEDVPFDDVNIFDSDDVFGRTNELRPLPDSIIIIGAGVIGIEYATMFAALDIPVTLVDARPNPLSFVDDEISEVLFDYLLRKGMKLCFGHSYSKIDRIEGEGCEARARVHLTSGEELTADALLFALGRVPLTEGLGLEEVGVKLNARGQILVDDGYRTAVPSIFAAGDVIGFPSLASTSAEQGRVAAMHAINEPADYDHSILPFGVYTIPEMSMLGKVEQELVGSGTPYYVGTALWYETARGKLLGDITGALKLIFHRETHRLIGVHTIGEGATELLHIGQAVMHFDGTADYFCNSVFNYPTLAEAYKIAAYNAINRLAGTTSVTERLVERIGTMLAREE